MIIGYLIITVLLGLTAAYKFGRSYEHERQDKFGLYAVLTVLWPIIIPCVIVFLPFWFMAILGENHKQKALAKERKNAT